MRLGCVGFGYLAECLGGVSFFVWLTWRIRLNTQQEKDVLEFTGDVRRLLFVLMPPKVLHFCQSENID